MMVCIRNLFWVVVIGIVDFVFFDWYFVCGNLIIVEEFFIVKYKFISWFYWRYCVWNDKYF